jgi:CheY-like chemotaxis protein
MAGRHVLVVDDHDSCREILRDLLEGWGLRISTAGEAEEGLQTAESDPPDVALIDAEMPEKDGFWLAERLSDILPRLPRVMMLSSSFRLGDVARCEQLGVNAYVQKPVKHSELKETLLLVADGRIPAIQTGGGRLESAHPRRILLAEDSPMNQKLAGAILEGWGHRVLLANNGKEAVAIADSQPIDIILMDVEMPEMGGLDATRLIREREKSRSGRLPIFGLTAHVLDSDRERCREAGMDELIPKPIDIEKLFRKIEEAPLREAS